MLPGFRDCLKNPQSWIKAMDVREFIKVLQKLSLSKDEQKWIDDFTIRYLRFDPVKDL
jgi:hypothetical protein